MQSKLELDFADAASGDYVASQPEHELPSDAQGSDAQAEQIQPTKVSWVASQCAGDRFLVLGPADGDLAFLLAREGHHVCVVDVDPQRIAAAQMLLSGESDRLPGSLVIGDQIPAGQAFNAVILVHPADSFDQVRQLLRDAADAATGETTLVADMPLLPGKDEPSPLLPKQIVAALPGWHLHALHLDLDRLRLVAVGSAMSSDEDAEAVVDALVDAELLRLQIESHAYKRRASRTRRQLQRQVDQLSRRLDQARAEVDELRESTSFQLGYAFAAGVRSPREMLRLPGRLYRAVRSIGKRGAGAGSGVAAQRQPLFDEARKSQFKAAVRPVLDSGVEAVRKKIDELMPDAEAPMRAMGYLIAGRACAEEGRRDMEFRLAELALSTHRSFGMLRSFLQVALRAREMDAASATLREIHVIEAAGSRHAKAYLDKLRLGSSYKIAVLESIPPRLPSGGVDPAGRMVYVLHNSLPYSSGGYATRGHGIATGLHKLGHDIVCLTRPGYPLDIRPELAPVDVPLVDRIDGVPYQRSLALMRSGMPEYKYILRAADLLESELKRLSPAWVMAASNYVTGLPALIAARRLGIPFFYEVRGLWEITRMSRDTQFADSISFDVQRHIEGVLTREADHVFTLTEPMREELIERGVLPDRITLLPNSVDVERFLPRDRDEQLASTLGIPPDVPVIGYIGTFVDYEGLEDLARACVELKRRGRDFRLLLVGNENASGDGRGPITEEIHRIAEEGGLGDALMMPGRIPHELVEAYYSLLDVCPFPRKPWPVCEMVSPMKPLEALAMRKAVVVSSVRALKEMIQHEATGVVFDKGDVTSLTDALERLLDDPALRRRLGEAGREWVASERTWDGIARSLLHTVEGFARDVPMAASET